MKQMKISSPDELPDVAAAVLSYCANEKIFAFLGQMGAGKTTLIGAICKILGVKEVVSSPTFALVHEYAGKEKIFHLDLFRLKNTNEALEIGVEEFLTGNHYCFIEWPQLIEPLLPSRTVYVMIDIRNQKERLLTIKKQ